MSLEQIESIKVKNLKFDPENPRFAASNLQSLEQHQIVEEMFDSEQVIDLLNSIS